MAAVISAAIFWQIPGDNGVPAAAIRHDPKAEPGPDSRPSDWAWQQRTWPFGTADREAFREAASQAREMRREAAKTRRLMPVSFAGPSNIGGRVVDLEFDPHNPANIYAASATGGVFKSADGGLNWLPVFDDQANLTIGDIAMDPVNPGVLYVGTGEANGGHNNFPGGGVYKSTDGGQSWTFLGLDNTVSIGRILVDPLNPDRVFLAAVGSYFAPNPERGIYRSTNGGQTWESSLFVSDSTGAIDLIMDPQNPNRLIAAFWERVRTANGRSHLYGPTGGVFRSTDGGDSWENLNSGRGLPNPAGERVGRIGLALCQSFPDEVYAIYNDGSTYTGLYRSSNFGDSWTNADPYNYISNGVSTFSWYFGQVRVHPTNPERVWALDVSYMRSTDGGRNWPIIYGYGGPSELHVDHHALAFHPTNPDIMVEGNDGGINISSDGGVTFTKVAELPNNQFYEIGLDANNPERIYGGTQDNGTLRTLSGNTNDWQRIYGGDGFYVLVDHTDPNVIYAESQNGGLGRTLNGGATWSPATTGINGPRNWSTPVAMDPINPSILYYGTNAVYRTVDRALNWSSYSPDLTDGPGQARLGTITTIAVSEANNLIIWAGTDDANVWVSSNRGATWTRVDRAPLPERWVTRVVPDPINQDVAYLTYSGLRWVDPQPHVFRTADRGQTWTDISSNLPDAPVNAMAVDPTDNNYLYLGTDLGAYLSANLGQSWEYLSPDLPMVTVGDMKIHPTAYYLAIGTHARSIYKLDLSLVTGVKGPSDGPLPGDFSLDQNYPNPFNGETRIRFSLPARGEVRLAIYDVLGREVRSLAGGEFPAGAHQLSWDGRGADGAVLASGVYIYRLSVSGEQPFTQSRKMLLVQ